MSCSSYMYDINQQECSKRLFPSAARSYVCFGQRWAKPEHVQVPFLCPVSPHAFRERGRKVKGYFAPVCTYLVSYSIVLSVLLGHHTLDL